MRLAVAILLTAVLCPAARSEPAPCPAATTDTPRIGAALDRMRRSVDPCGESAEVAAVLDAFARCGGSRYEICTSADAARNVFTRADRAEERGRIVWNPDLRSELEPGCDGDPARPVMRDPTASLLHEIAHAVADCAGLDAGAHELDAVRVENIYRRAAGLCQRSRYGDEPLAPGVCEAGVCRCPAATGGSVPPSPRTPHGRAAADAAR